MISRLKVFGFGLVGMVLLAIGPAYGQLKTKVTVNTNQTKATIYTTSIGINADRWDNNAYNSDTVQLLMDAGITELHLPGGDGIDALYHWSTGKVINPYTHDRAPAFAAQNMFPAVVPVVDALGTAIVAVNYGSNLDGSGGGEPAEAAAWVAYANGDPLNTQVIGKDSKGNDWKTVGYWASLRASAPLATDDGYNHLRINHPRPIGIQLWTVGSEPWGDGFYGQSRTVGSDADADGGYNQSPSPEADLHAGPVNDSKDWGRHQGNKSVGPTAYGEAVVQYAKAMKAVDPHIFVGAYVMQPPYANDANQTGKNWNEDVLKAACGSMDFSAADFWEGKGQPPEWNYLDEQDLLLSALDEMDATKNIPNQNGLRHHFALLGHDLIDKYKKFCPKGHAPQIAITNMGMGVWLPTKNPASVALFTADSMAWLLETGAYTVVWGPIHAPAKAYTPVFLDDKNQPAPGYYGIEMLHNIAGVGDVLVGANSEMDTLVAYASKRRDGGLGVLLINKDATRSTAVTVSVPGYNYSTKGTRYDYGKTTIEAGKDITETPINNLGPSFTVDVPRYGITAIVIPKQGT
jgi:hypothetical protein